MDFKRDAEITFFIFVSSAIEFRSPTGESRTLTSTFRSLFSEFRSPTIVSRSRLIFYFQLIKRLSMVDHRNVEPKLGPNSFGVKYVPRLTVAKGKRGP